MRIGLIAGCLACGMSIAGTLAADPGSALRFYGNGVEAPDLDEGQLGAPASHTPVAGSTSAAAERPQGVSPCFSQSLSGCR